MIFSYLVCMEIIFKYFKMFCINKIEFKENSISNFECNKDYLNKMLKVI